MDHEAEFGGELNMWTDVEVVVEGVVVVADTGDIIDVDAGGAATPATVLKPFRVPAFDSRSATVSCPIALAPSPLRPVLDDKYSLPPSLSFVSLAFHSWTTTIGGLGGACKFEAVLSDFPDTPISRRVTVG